MGRDALSKPEGYPLPWNHKVGMPYWPINMWFILYIPGWRYFQKDERISSLIPFIDKTLEEIYLNLGEKK